MTVSIEHQASVTRIRLNRPDVHNAFNEHTIAALIAAFEQVNTTSSCRVVVLEAAGKSFSAGADLNWMKKMATMSHDENVADARQLARLMQSIDQCAKPVVCKVQGAAYGGALGLICASDIALAADTARFCLSEVKLGLLPAVISPYVVRALGARQAQRYFMTGEVFDADTALQLNLVHTLSHPAQLDEDTDYMVSHLLKGAPLAQVESRALIARVAHQPINEATCDYTADLIARLRAAEEGKEGVQAFLEKRSPHWQES